MRKTSLLLAIILLVSFTATAEMAGPGRDGPIVDSVTRPSTSGENAMDAPRVLPSSLSTQSEQRYTIRSGDTLWDIALQNKVPLADLLAANGLAPNSLLSVGQVLLIPGSTGNKAATTASPSIASVAAVRYSVQRGNTLWDIAVAYGVTVEAVMKANRLNKDSILAVGQEVFIPGPKRTPAAGELAPALPAPPETLVSAAASDTQVAPTLDPGDVSATEVVSETLPAEAPPEIVATEPVTETAPEPTAAEAVVVEVQPVEAPAAALLIFALMNEKRAGHGLAPLAWSPALAQAAQAHAEDCARRDFGSHVGSDGARLRQRLTRAGYLPSAASENWVYSHSPQRGVEWWYSEPPGRDPHRRNILSNQYAEVGVGIVQDESGLYYIVADFGRS